MENEFLNLISSPLMNLDHTYRYSGTKLVEPESLSQHIVDTIMLGLKIIDKINSICKVRGRYYPDSNKIFLDPYLYIMKATYHDLEEVITGDIPRPLKYYNDDTLNSMKNVADEVAKKFFNAQFEDSRNSYHLWSSAKEGNEGIILKIVDTLVVAYKVVKEVSLLHNFYMLRVAHEVRQYLEEMYTHFKNTPDFLNTGYISVDNYLLSIIEGAITAMEEITSENADVMLKLNISSQSMI